jgi:hypothetical protein
MGLLSRPTPAPPTPETVWRCEACKSTTSTVKPITVGPGLVVDACVNPVTCRRTAQAAGTWMQYP